MDFKQVKLMLDLSTALIFGLAWLVTVLYLRLKKNKNFTYLVFFTIFYIYIFKVLDYTIFQFQSLFLLKHFLPNLIVNGQTARESLNLVPLTTLTREDVKTSLLNILLFVPFGFGLPFITSLRLKKVVVVGVLFSIILELLQLLTGYMAHVTFRVTDINDVVFNTLGVAIGYSVFIVFVRTSRSAVRNRKQSANLTLQYIVERPQVDK